MTDKTELEYNTGRNPLVIKDYGRNIQKMAEFAKTIEDKEERTQFCNYIVKIMEQNFSNSSVDLQRTLWDHLHIITNFELDVDAPYPKPTENDIFSKPEPIAYSEDKPVYRQYGKNIEYIISKAIEEKDEEQKKILTKIIANHMKKLYLNWNRESVSDDLIIEHLSKLSDGKLTIDEEELKSTSDILSKIKRKKPLKVTNKKPRKKRYTPDK